MSALAAAIPTGTIRKTGHAVTGAVVAAQAEHPDTARGEDAQAESTQCE